MDMFWTVYSWCVVSNLILVLACAIRDRRVLAEYRNRGMYLIVLWYMSGVAFAFTGPLATASAIFCVACYVTIRVVRPGWYKEHRQMQQGVEKIFCQAVVE